MRSTFKILFYINKNKVKADGTTAILCRISIDGKQSVITTGIYCSPGDWNTKKGIIKIERENNKLITYRNRIENTYNHILKEQGVISAELLKNTIIGVNSIPTMLLQAGGITWLNKLIYIAIDQEVLRSNPLEEVRYEKKESPKHKHIGKDDFKRLLETPIPEERLELVSRAFIFSTLTGLAYVDIYGLYPHHIQKTSEGRLYIRKRRVKTNVEAFIPLHPIAEQILMLYNTTETAFPCSLCLSVIKSGTRSIR